MNVFSIVLTVALLAILALLIVLFLDLRRIARPAEVVQSPVDARMTALELQFGSLKGAVEEELERARRAWSRARAAESKLRRDQELEDGEEDSPPDEQLSFADDSGGRGQGLLPVHPVLEESEQGIPPHIQAARAYARSILGA